jgi:RimJ/RimL family protein N-acetyltransferase
MIKLVDVTEQNWLDVVSLSVREEQRKFLDTPLGIIARGYIYRSCNANVYAISNDEHIIGVALVKDMDEEPACYDLQQFMIDQHFQNKGYGTEALGLILSALSKERKYGQVEVCVNKNDAAALWMYKKVGFEDTGYIDESVPDCCNLMYHFTDPF